MISNEQLNYGDTILGGAFSLVQTRLKDGAVYVNHDKSQYLRIGDKELSIAEEIQTRTLAHKGFPVAKIVRHGEVGDKWYFIEESLGERPLGHIFGDEYAAHGAITDQTFAAFMSVMKTYADASLAPTNRHRTSESLHDISLVGSTRQQYPIDQGIFDSVLSKLESRLTKVPAATLNTDLGPFNIMTKGVIDLEFVHVGPQGYDLMTAPMVGYFFPERPGYRHALAYRFTPQQLNEYYSMVDKAAHKHGAPSPLQYINDFAMLKTIWAAARPNRYEQRAFDDPERERFWSEFRANILQYALTAYLHDQDILFERFPEIGVGQLDNK